EGVCLEAMPPARAAEDPLMAAVTAIEAEGARIPGFGAELADWVLRVLTPLDAAEARLMRASAHLADIAWRSHPDHRVAASWELATRATLTGIGHPGRVHLGLALATRYRRSRKVEEEIPALSLLDAAGRERAVALGLALRLGCSLAACAPGVLGRVRPVRAEGALGLEIDAEAAEMAGEDSVKRLGHLARHLGLAPLPVAIRP
ncbi:MAG: exopolyphosphatase, partial [Pseudomonadota bacterium]